MQWRRHGSARAKERCAGRGRVTKKISLVGASFFCVCEPSMALSFQPRTAEYVFFTAAAADSRAFFFRSVPSTHGAPRRGLTSAILTHTLAQRASLLILRRAQRRWHTLLCTSPRVWSPARASGPCRRHSSSAGQPAGRLGGGDGGRRACRRSSAAARAVARPLWRRVVAAAMASGRTAASIFPHAVTKERMATSASPPAAWLYRRECRARER